MIIGIIHVLVHLIFGDELIKTGIREEIDPFPAPGFAANTGRLGACKQFHRRYAPHMLQISLIAAVIRTGIHKGFQFEQILRQQIPVFLSASPFGNNCPHHHSRGNTAQLFPQALFPVAADGRNALAHIIQHTAQAEEILNAFLHSQLKALHIALLKGHVHRIFDRRQKLDINFLFTEQGQQAGDKR